jgi:phosphatidate phosphatase APP1
MASLYQNWSRRSVSIHFVSSTPWQLYTDLSEFAENSGFPWASFSLKSVRFRDETLFNLFKKGTETKPLQIEPILRAYPNRRFILIGDSGEEDPEVYAGIFKKYPSQIIRVYIRSVNNYIQDQKRMQALYSGLMQEGSVDSPSWTLFTHPGELALPEI